MQKYYFFTFDERNGEFEYNHKKVVALKDDVSVEDYANDWLKRWYMSTVAPDVLEDGSIEFFGGEIVVKLAGYKEIDYADYKVLVEFL